jgi:hypothetical protein
MPSRVRTEERARRSRKLDADLDKALAQTFPASDPFSVGRFTSTEPPSRSVDHQAPEPVVAPRRRRRRKSPS